MIILGLDISTKYVGYTLLQNEKLIDIGHIDLSKMDKMLWSKVDKVRGEIKNICKKHIKNEVPDKIFIEEPVYRFASRRSSANTIITAAKFNALVSFALYEQFGCLEPEYIVSTHARKACGIKIKRNGVDAKKQVFDHLSKIKEFKNKEWPLKRTGKLKDYIEDELDSYVIALAGYLESGDLE